MATDVLAIGDVILVTLPSHAPSGHEQEGKRPVVVVGVPAGETRYPVVAVVPLTTQIGAWVQKNPALYPQIEQGNGGLTHMSVVLLDQVRSLDVRRIDSYLGTLDETAINTIRRGLQQIFEF